MQLLFKWYTFSIWDNEKVPEKVQERDSGYCRTTL